MTSETGPKDSDAAAYRGDFPADAINGGDAMWGLEAEAGSLENLAAAARLMASAEGDTTGAAIGHLADAIERHARRLAHFHAQLARKAHDARVQAMPPRVENPILLRLLRDRLLHAAGEVTETLGDTPAPAAPLAG